MTIKEMYSNTNFRILKELNSKIFDMSSETILFWITNGIPKGASDKYIMTIASNQDKFLKTLRAYAICEILEEI